MKILHFADTHVRDKDIEECDKILNFLVDQAWELRPDLIIHAGDVFDSQNIKLDSASAKLVFDVLSDLADIAPVIIVIGTPSHDGLSIEVARHIKANHRIYVSTRPEQIYFMPPDIVWEPPPNDFVSIADAVISCMPAPTKQFFQSEGSIAETDQEIGDAMTGIMAGFAAQAASYDAPHILVGHFQVGGATVSTGQQLIGREIEVSKSQIEAANADLVCLGHIHKSQKIDDEIFYSGSTYPLTYGELEEKGFYVHEIDLNPSVDYLTSTFIKTPTRKLFKSSLDLTAGNADDVLDDIYKQAIETRDIDCADVRLEISVYEDEVDNIGIEDLKAELIVAGGASSVDIQLIRIPRENVRSAALLQLTTLREKIIERAALVREEVSESILAKADLLESENPDKIFNELSAA